MLGKLNFACQDLHSRIIGAMGDYCPPAFLEKPTSFLSRLDWKPMNHGWYAGKFISERCGGCVGLVFINSLYNISPRPAGYTHVVDVRYLNNEVWVTYSDNSSSRHVASQTGVNMEFCRDRPQTDGEIL